MRSRPVPDVLESFGARLDHLGIVAQIMPHERPVPGEEPEAHESVIEQPEVGQRYEQARRSVPGQPPDLLTRSDIKRRRLVLEAEVECPLHMSRFDLRTGAVDAPPEEAPNLPLGARRS